MGRNRLTCTHYIHAAIIKLPNSLGILESGAARSEAVALVIAVGCAICPAVFNKGPAERWGISKSYRTKAAAPPRPTMSLESRAVELKRPLAYKPHVKSPRPLIAGMGMLKRIWRS
ncbi:unnamed protein product, partial [Iphiclides podalirius]